MLKDRLAERSFGQHDQEWFASVSGDSNPMHMDALAARRTMAGSPVVHGIHTLLWCLDCLFRTLPSGLTVASVKASFEKMIYLGDRVHAVLLECDDKHAVAEARIGQITVMAIEVVFGTAETEAAPLPAGPAYRPEQPANRSFDEIEDMSGHIPIPPGHPTVVAAFPAVVAFLGAERVAGLLGSTFLVGMVCPGLHSLYRGLTLSAVSAAPAELRFRVKYADLDYRFVRMEISGAGWFGQIDTNLRPSPTAQADLASLATRVAADEFAGVAALVVGGSRGLGELVAKILAAGGAHVAVTYAVGEADARRVQSDVTAFGGRCDVLRYDVGKGAAEQLAGLGMMPDQVYFMATPAIFRRAEAAFVPERFQDFVSFYVTGFSDLCEALRARGAADMAVFYPSSVSLDDRPANMTEYTMAKAAGEVLCADMKSFGHWRNILVRRLPRLPTDQTATLFDDENEDPVDVMLPIVREMGKGS